MLDNVGGGTALGTHTKPAMISMLRYQDSVGGKSAWAL